MHLSDTIMIKGPNSSLDSRTKDMIVQMISQCGLQQPKATTCESILSEIMGQVNETGKSVMNLSTAMNYLRYYWKYNLPNPEGFRSQVFENYNKLNLPNAAKFFGHTLIQLEDQPSFSGMMFLNQYVCEGTVLGKQDRGIASLSIGFDNAISQFLGFVHCATTTLVDFKGQNNVLGDFVAAADAKWYTQITAMGTPDLESGCLWASFLNQIAKSSDGANFRVDIIRKYPRLEEMVTNYSTEALKYAIQGVHPTAISSIVLKPFLWMIGSSLS